MPRPTSESSDADAAWPVQTGRVLATACLAQIALWTLVPALLFNAPPLDVVEGYMWGPEHVLATYKHPALPAALLEVSRRLTGAIGWPAYLVSQLCIALTFLAVYQLGRDGLGRERALVGALLLAGVVYFSVTTPELNHNVVQMPLWAGIALALWRAIERQSLVWWIAAGALAGLSLYAKLSSALFLLVCTAWVLWDAKARSRLRTAGPIATVAVGAAVVAPLASWLVAHDFLPLTYAQERATLFGRFGLIFLVEQMLALAPMLAILAWAGLLPARGGASLPTPVDDEAGRFQRYLLILTLGPILLTVAGALITGYGVKGMWGVPMLSLTGLIAISWARPADWATAAARARRASLVVLCALPFAFAVYYLGSAALSREPKRQEWPQIELAARMRALWSEATGAPLRIVAGDPTNWTAGIVGLSTGPMPSLLTNGDMRLSPWVTPERLRCEGVLVVWRAGTPPTPALEALIGGRPRHEIELTTRQFVHVKKVAIGYAIVAPQR